MFAGAELENYHEKMAAAVESWMTRPGANLYIHGQVGTGKTHLAAAALKAAMRRKDCQGKWVSVPELMLRLRQTFGNGATESEGLVVDDVVNAKLLVLDDLGAEKHSEYAAATLYVIVDQRYSNLRETIVTSNLDLNELSKRMGDRLASRLAHGVQVKLTGKDRRL